jgi:hypothetical protein
LGITVATENQVVAVLWCPGRKPLRPSVRRGQEVFQLNRLAILGDCHRITDLFRKKKPEASTNDPVVAEDGEFLALEDLLPSPDAGPEAAYARTVLLEELEDALEELPEEQRKVFLAHEVEGLSFKELAVETGLSVNTLLSRKHYAVIHLRERLRDVYDEFTKTGGQEK